MDRLNISTISHLEKKFAYFWRSLIVYSVLDLKYHEEEKPESPHKLDSLNVPQKSSTPTNSVIHQLSRKISRAGGSFVKSLDENMIVNLIPDDGSFVVC